jgi:glycosyltransferase involved in cell wall biosynthesis
MNDKVLSVIIPSYNMEALLPRCLDGLCCCSERELLDVIIVNDGSRDGTLKIAQDYASRYPDFIRYIDKPNGNYGSTINAALPSLRGKYVKILDADDEYDSIALSKLLHSLTTCVSDIVVMPFREVREHKRDIVVRYDTMGREPYQYNHQYTLDDILPDGYIRFLLMHGVAYRSALLTDNGYHQSEGLSYTDVEWVTFPLYWASTVTFSDCCVYRYHLDREGQTMDPAVLSRNIGQLIRVTGNLLTFHNNANLGKMSAIRRLWLEKYLENRLRVIYKHYLYDIRSENFDAQELRAAEDALLPLANKIGLHPSLYADNKIVRIDLISYWNNNGERLPKWLEITNNTLDKLAHWFHDALRME